MRRILSAFSLLAILLALPLSVAAQSAASADAYPERAVRRDVPLTNAIQRAFEAGTRDLTGTPGPNYWQLRVDYTIAASIDPATSRVTASETVLLHNTSPDALDAIALRLNQNVFAANVARGERMPEITDGMVVTRIVVNGEVIDLNATPPRRRPGQPAPEVTQSYAGGLQTTTGGISLEDPIPPGETATLEIDWNFEVPGADGTRGLRMGAWGDTLYQVAQWYPQVAVYDDLRGWNIEPYLGNSEFFHNFGSFDVTIDAPAGWVVGATGVLQNPDEVLSPRTQERLAAAMTTDETTTIVGADELGTGTVEGDRLQWHYTADLVNDFAWATSAKYVWEATRVAIPGGDVIPFDWMYLRGDAPRYAAANELGRHALQFYSELWTPYAFPKMTMVDGPDTGMEYPMFIMSATGAEDHEIGHEWWPMMVGTNETWYGFMDEGFNQYMGRLSRAARNGEEPNLDGLGQSYGRISGDEREAPLMWNANYGGPMYGYQAYSKAPLMLSMLGGVVGDEAVWEAMSDYTETWLFKHPSPWDYAFFMSEALGQDLGWFWYYWLFTTERVDGSIHGVSTSGSTTTVTVHQAGQMPSPVVLRVDFAAEGPDLVPMDNAEMVGTTTAIVTWPVDVWFGGSRTFEATLDFGGRTIESITLDPGARFPDRDASDNVWTSN